MPSLSSLKSTDTVGQSSIHSPSQTSRGIKSALKKVFFSFKEQFAGGFFSKAPIKSVVVQTLPSKVDPQPKSLYEMAPHVTSKRALLRVLNSDANKPAALTQSNLLANQILDHSAGLAWRSVESFEDQEALLQLKQTPSPVDESLIELYNDLDSAIDDHLHPSYSGGSFEPKW